MKTDTGEQHANTGITWDASAIPFDQVQLRSTPDALDRLCARLPQLVWNAAALEGNPMTHADVESFMADEPGRTPVNDAEVQVRNLSRGYRVMERLVRGGEFELTKALSDEIHGYVGRHEAIEAGHFRGQGSILGGGTVRLAGGGVTPGRDPGPGGTNLIHLHKTLRSYLSTISDTRERALVYFAAATRAQFYFDANKRTARIMASGILLRSGYDALDIAFALHREFDQALYDLFGTDSATTLLRFLVNCMSE